MQRAAVLVSVVITAVGPASALAQTGYEPSASPSRIALNPAEQASTSQAFTWRTDTATTAGTVQVEPLAGGERVTVEATPGEPVSFAGWAYESLHHSATVTDLAPDTPYRYRVGTEGAWSSWHLFKTASDGAEAWTMLYFGDAQNELAGKWAPVVARAFNETPGASLSLHAGDLINSANVDSEWGEWFGAIGNQIATIPALPTPGNHEQSGDPTMIQFREHFTNPLNGPISQDELVYYTDFQGVRFISLNSDAMYDPSAMLFQQQFLDSALANNPNRWSVVTFHHPIFSASEGRTNPTLQVAFKPILERHNVDLVLQGHDHSYARGHVTENETDVPGVHTGPVYAVSVSGPKYYELEPADNNDWTRNGATRWVAHQHTSTFQQIQFDGDVIRYRSVIAAKDGESDAPGGLGETLDSFTIRKLSDGTKRVSDGATFSSVTEATAAPVHAGQAAQVEVTVTSLPKPSGAIEVVDGDALLATGSVVDGTATVAVPTESLAPGAHGMTVRYLGNEEVEPSATTFDLVVECPSKAKRKCERKRQ